MKNINSICKVTWKNLSVKNSSTNSQIMKKSSFKKSSDSKQNKLFQKRHLCKVPS